MDVEKTLRELHEEKRKLDLAIAALEARLGSGSRTRGRRRGRKGMSAAERQEVSRRMSKYWEARRASAAALQSEPERQRQTSAAVAGNSLTA